MCCKRTRMFQQGSFYPLKTKREWSFILSVPLHQNSNHIAFISDSSILPCFYYPFPSSPCPDSSISTALKTKPFPLHRQPALCFQEALCIHSGSPKKPLVAPCKKKEIWHWKQINILRSSEAEASTFHTGAVFLPRLQVKVTGVFCQLSRAADLHSTLFEAYSLLVVCGLCLLLEYMKTTAFPPRE